MSRGQVTAVVLSLLLAVSACVSDSPTIEDTVVEADPSDAPMIRLSTY